jgi:hypothetical protein
MVGIAMVLVWTSAAFAPGPMEDYAGDNPIGIQSAEHVLSIVGAVGWLAILVGALLSVASVVVRFRHSHGVERQQIKWFVYAACLLLPYSVISDRFDPRLAEYIFPIVVMLPPVSTGIAILRYRLYDIDRIINRTLAYTALSASLLLVYLALVVGLESAMRLFTAEDSSLVVAASTLAVAALFQPCARCFKRESIAVSTGTSTTRPERWRISVPGCVTRWSWRHWKASCARLCARRCSPHLCRSGCVIRRSGCS